MPYFFLDRTALDEGAIAIRDWNDPAYETPEKARLDLGWHVCEEDARKKLNTMVADAIGQDTPPRRRSA